MTDEEAKKIYYGLNFKELNDKVVTSMMEIIQLPSPDEAHTLFHRVIERFTKEEMAFLTCTHVAEKFRDILKKMNNLKDDEIPEDIEVFISNLKK